MLNRQVPLPTVRHLVTRFIANVGTAKTGPETVWRAKGRLRRGTGWVGLHVEEPSVVIREILKERGILAADLERKQAVTVKELPNTCTDGPLTLPRGIVRETEAR